MKTIRAIIIDDEEACRSALQTQLRWSCPQVEVVATANGKQTGTQVIAEFKPEVVFLDIEMPGGSGFEMLQEIDEVDFEIIFTTAYDQYALRAFKVHAQSYLLKPIDEDDLKKAIDHLKSRRKVDSGRIDELLTYVTERNDASPKKIAIPVSDGLEIVATDDIIRCESDGSYCHIYLQDGKKIFISKTLKQVQALINHKNFVRVHHSHVVNLDFVKKYIKGAGGQIILHDSATIPVSRNKKDDFLSQW